MAYKIVSSDSSLEEGLAKIVAICDAQSDLTNLGTNFASMSLAFVTKSGGHDVYILGASKTWEVL